MVISEITDVADAVQHLNEQQAKAHLSPAEMRANIAAANAKRAESIVRELNAYQQLVDLGAMSEEALDKAKEKLKGILELEAPSAFDDDFIDGDMRSRYLSIPRETWRSWTPVQRQHFVYTGELPEERPKTEDKPDEAPAQESTEPAIETLAP